MNKGNQNQDETSLYLVLIEAICGHKHIQIT